MDTFVVRPEIKIDGCMTTLQQLIFQFCQRKIPNFPHLFEIRTFMWNLEVVLTFNFSPTKNVLAEASTNFGLTKTPGPQFFPSELTYPKIEYGHD
jgi:hypothetical protein